MSLPKRALNRERLFIGVYAAFAAAILMHFTALYYRGCCGDFFALDVSGQPAPQVYRVALPFLFNCIQRLHHVSGPTLLGGLDFVFGFLAIWLFYQVVSSQAQGISALRRSLRVGLFLSVLLFPLFFVIPWERPETLPSACYLGFALLCLERVRIHWIWTLLLLTATALQSFVRSDVSFIFGLALFALALFSNSLKDYGARTANLLRGAAVTGLAGGIQCYLQFVLFPHRAYMTGSPFMARYNLSPHIFWVPLIAVLPVALAVAPILRQQALSAAEALIVTASVLFLPVWFAIGIVLEVRIFVPFLMALCVVAARSSETYLVEPAHPDSA